MGTLERSVAGGQGEGTWGAEGWTDPEQPAGLGAGWEVFPVQ